MQEFQLKFQKTLMTICLVVASAMIFYALGFSTNIYPLSYHSNPESPLFYVPGAELYPLVQPFNRAFFLHTVWYFLVCITLFLSLTHRRRLYYASNYVTSTAFAGASVALGVELITHALAYRAAYLTVDFVRLKEVTDLMSLPYYETTFILDLGIFLSIVMFLTAAALIVNLVLKTQWMKLERWAEPGEGDAA